MTAHAVMVWLATHHMTADQIRIAMIHLIHQVQHLRLHKTTIWLTHINGGVTKSGGERILAVTVKMGRGVLAAHWG